MQTENLHGVSGNVAETKGNHNATLERAAWIAAETEKSPLTNIRPNADLLAVVNAWETLPPALKAGIVAMVKAAQQQTQGDGA